MWAIYTTDDSPEFGAGTVWDINLDTAVGWLERNPRNALRLGAGSRPGRHVGMEGGGRYVLRGASEEQDNYYWGDYPPEDPNDAEGGNLTAKQAVQAALQDLRLGESPVSDKDKKPTINEIACNTSHILNEQQSRPYTGTVNFYKDEIDAKGDGTLWAMAEYMVAYDWTHDPGSYDTPPISDFDVTDVRVKEAQFYTNEGEEVEVPPEQAVKILTDYFWTNNLDTDEVLADKVHEQTDAGARSRY